MVEGKMMRLYGVVIGFSLATRACRNQAYSFQPGASILAKEGCVSQKDGAYNILQVSISSSHTSQQLWLEKIIMRITED